MSNYTWNNAAGGDWSNAADWTGRVPVCHGRQIRPGISALSKNTATIAGGRALL
jgi:hypothetical protein